MSSFEHLPGGWRDILTELPNRLALKEHLDAAIEDAPGQFAVLEIDLYRFKEINDTYGHSEGDAFLRNVADILNATLRDEDQFLSNLPVHKSGDEFTIILYEITSDEVVLLIQERIRQVLDDHGIEISIGGRKHQEGEPIETLMIEADLLMRADRNEHKQEQYAAPSTRVAIGQIALLTARHFIAPRDLPLLLAMHEEGII